MKTLYESLLTGSVSKPRAKVQPSSRKELQQLIDEHIKEIKPQPGQKVDLNWIDISLVKDLRELFASTSYIPVIDTWKIDHVKNFSFMFARNKHIVRSPLPVLQEKLLSENCYERMFMNCPALKEPPVLPAMKLKPYCYVGMFYNCTSLETAPELPAMKLENGCYLVMFEECSSLKVAPELPAENLAYGCYGAMFAGCTTLKEPPVLPATKLEKHCYERMFQNCTALKESPKLPATNLTRCCYEEMFKNCNNLKTKAKIPAGVNLDIFAAQGMYTGCPCDK